ncbi:DUF5753 domain-containing protein [Streptomyces spiramenti]|uniref:Transcriptional regulator n=1 Tax=Streptomyces spiramenti TaxID=2720606 RepID=A0ABX1AK89_9ACTN|nr:DUF5753 domain-containing protein [Streptomyces spiramenti]NJP66421.1 transcriptional regulator [Streptomyces spiramenti]
MGYSGTHISAVETGRKMPTLRLARSADEAFGLGGAIGNFERQWREIQYGTLLEGFPEYVRHEGRATEIRLYEVGVLPGLVQTSAYTSELVASEVKRGAVAAEQAAERITLVAERQAALARSHPPLVFVTLDESCIRRPIGDSAVMREQFEHLEALADRPNYVIQVAPFAMGVRRPFNLPVTILTLPDRSLMSYAESAQRGHLERDNRFVLPLLTTYHQLQAEALSQAQSVALIEQVRKGTP